MNSHEQGGQCSEAECEWIAVEAFSDQGWEAFRGSEVLPGTHGGRKEWSDLVIPDRTLAAMKRLNPAVPADYLAQTFV